MSNVYWFISYKLKKDVSVEEFMVASEKCVNEVLSKQKGFVKWEVLKDGDTWIDLVEWESEEDAKAGETAGENNPVAHEFYSFINMPSCKQRLYSIEKKH